MRQDLRIIVEGPDGGGKSTLIARLCADFEDLEVIRNDLGPQQDFDIWWAHQLNRPKSAAVPIHDRFFFSELVYGPIIRGKLAAGEVLINNVAWMLRSFSLLIYARPHSDILRVGVKQIEQMEGVHHHFEALLDSYDLIMTVEQAWFKQRFIRYDWNNEDSYPEVRTRVRSYLAGELM